MWITETMPAKLKKSVPPVRKKPSYLIPEGEIDVLKVLVRSTLGRKKGNEAALTEISFGDVRVDFVKQELFRSGRRMTARTREFELLKYFLLHEGKVITRDQLLRDVWGFDHNPTTRSVDNYVLRLRKNIEADHSAPRHLLTLHKAGYKFIR
jgi:two-component system, OmpR family, alkaline phosphatase synthesis response regulator PhoP